MKGQNKISEAQLETPLDENEQAGPFGTPCDPVDPDFFKTGQILDILTYPHPILTTVAKPVIEFNEELRTLCHNMICTMYDAPGIGLAAPQVGVSKRIFVLDVDYDRAKKITSEGEEEFEISNLNPRIFINPSIMNPEGQIIYQEGCLSLPGIYEEIERFHKIHVEYFTVDGEKRSMTAEDLLSICIQHENDHLNGIVFLEKLGQIKKNLLKKKLTKQKKLKKLA